ncbi:MAG: BMC domain-containing protein [Klebsiella variicola]|nr:BMC domain-containing protein [Klebsiella variicola]
MGDALGLIETKGLVADVGAVKAAVDSGVESAQRIGEVVTSLVIARPHNDINKIVSHYKIAD